MSSVSDCNPTILVLCWMCTIILTWVAVTNTQIAHVRDDLYKDGHALIREYERSSDSSYSSWGIPGE